MRGPRDGDLRTWSGTKVSSHKQSSSGAAGLSSGAGDRFIILTSFRGSAWERNVWEAPPPWSSGEAEPQRQCVPRRSLERVESPHPCPTTMPLPRIFPPNSTWSWRGGIGRRRSRNWSGRNTSPRHSPTLSPRTAWDMPTFSPALAASAKLRLREFSPRP